MTPESWLDERRPPVPAEFRSWVADALTSGPEAFEDLLREARRALERALDPEGRPRGGAFDLLVADALVTWAAEEALALPDGEARLRELVRSLAG